MLLKTLLPGCMAAMMFISSPAAARVEASSNYTKVQTYSGALRYLRLDLDYEVVEKDPDAAYLVFRYVPPGDAKRLLTGTIEVVETDGAVKVFVQLPQMPEYHERMLRDGLMKKLRAEYGTPAPKNKEAPKQPPPSDPPKGDTPDKPKKG